MVDGISVVHEIYPAHAGINLWRINIENDADNLPRTRGDKPIGSGEVGDGTASTPHTRG